MLLCDQVRTVLRRGADIDATNYDGRTALSMVIKCSVCKLNSKMWLWTIPDLIVVDVVVAYAVLSFHGWLVLILAKPVLSKSL